MRAKAKRNITVEKAEDLTKEISGVFNLFEDLEKGLTKKEEEEIWEDKYGAQMGFHQNLQEDEDKVSFWNITCGGNRHELEIDTQTGSLSVTHQGKRSSERPSLLRVLRETSFPPLSSTEDWELVENDSSRQDWAVRLALLEGKFGTGPCNLRDELALREAEKKRIYKTLGLTWPEGVVLRHDERGKPQWEKNYEKCDSPKNALFYRRAGAMGVPT